MRIRCKLPAKLILSGEHAVVYGAPALACAINQFGEASLEFTPSLETNLFISLPDLNQRLELSHNQIWLRVKEVEQRFADFSAGKISISEVCQTPFDLVLVSLAKFLSEFSIELPAGNYQLSYASEIWQNRGLGSSAALIVGFLKCWLEFFVQQKLLDKTSDDKNILLKLAQTIESFQHGKSSGLDPATILHGGVIRFEQGKIIPQKIDLNLFTQTNFWLIDSGEPSSSTGETVAAVKAKNLPAEIWADFARITNSYNQIWLQQDISQLNNAMKQNQALLHQIGVVPSKTQQIIATLQDLPNSSAKVCGAGASSGEQAGVILLASEQSPQEICQSLGLRFSRLEIVETGAKIEVY